MFHKYINVYVCVYKRVSTPPPRRSWVRYHFCVEFCMFSIAVSSYILKTCTTRLHVRGVGGPDRERGGAFTYSHRRALRVRVCACAWSSLSSSLPDLFSSDGGAVVSRSPGHTPETHRRCSMPFNRVQKNRRHARTHARRMMTD